MQGIHNIQIDGTNLPDGIGGIIGSAGSGKDGVSFGTVSAGTDKKIQTTEKLSKSEQTTEVTYRKPQREKGAGTTKDVMDQAEYLDAGRMKNQMVVASNTTTTTDCKKMEEDGFSLQQTEIKTVVTVTDKIKIALAKAGVDISYFGDDIDVKQLEAVSGNIALAQTLAGKIEKSQADLPLTPENITDCDRALRETGELHALNDGALKYMLDNGLEPTIANLYKAQYSGSVLYVNRNTEQIPLSGMEDQVANIIAQAGQQENEQAVADSRWLIQNQVPLTADNLNYLRDLKGMEFPQDTDSLLDEMITAISEGKRPQDAVLLKGYSLKGQAQKAVDIVSQVTDEDLAYAVSKGEQLTIKSFEQIHNRMQAGAVSAEDAAETARLVQETAQPVSDIPENTKQNRSDNQLLQYTEIQITLITARRQLEEVRLKMTVEASYFMQKQGIAVDTSPIEELVSHLKEIENNFYKNLLTQGGIEASEANVSLFAETSDKIEQLKEMPAYALGARNMQVATLSGLHQEGSAMQQNFRQANERYETMQTQARKDLGDSIEKAFGNIDDILREIGQEASPENERAARILGYNRIEITPENITRMKAADKQVQMAFHNLTPPVIREFIRRGIHPLDLDMGELNRQAQQIKEELKIDVPEEKYSEYLYKLEQNQNISKEERSSYIGIYRLMNQIARSDGAAVGAVVYQGTQLTMRNLLEAVRSERRGNIDVAVDASFGELESGGYKNSITRQIEAGYQDAYARQVIEAAYQNAETKQAVEAAYQNAETKQAVEADYQDACAKQAFEALSPERLRTLMEKADWEDLTPEQFLRQLQEAPEDTAAEEAYYRQQLEDLSRCAEASDEVYKFMEEYRLPNTVMNVLAVSEMLQNRNGAYRRLFSTGSNRTPDSAKTTDAYRKETEDGSFEADFEALKEELLRRFGEEIKKPKELAKAVAQLAECAEKCMRTMILEPDVSSLDIRSLKLMNAQISVNTKMASSECFSMPIVVDGEVTNVTLKIVRGKDEKGLINITLETSLFGKIAAEFRAKNDRISGFIATGSAQGRDLLKSAEEEVKQALQNVQDGPVDIFYIVSGGLDLNRFAQQSGSSEEPETEDLREVQTRTLYGMAEGFIQALMKLDKTEKQIL